MVPSHTTLISVLVWKNNWDKVCRWNEGAYKAIGHPLVEVRLCGYSNELRGLLHGIKELVVIILIAGLAFSRR